MDGLVIRAKTRELAGHHLLDMICNVPQRLAMLGEIKARLHSMICEAEVARDLLAHSWRASDESPVLIGCCILGRNKAGEYRTFIGGNNTWRATPRPMPIGYQKPCAERITMSVCLEQEYYPVAVVIFTEYNQTDDITGEVAELLMPCHTCCEDVLGALPGQMPVYSARRRRQGDGPELGEFAEYVYLPWTLNGLRVFHKIPGFSF